MLTRPTVADVFAYRRIVDQRMARLLGELAGDAAKEIGCVVELGLQHEQQHQELILTDLKYLFSCNPLWPAYRESSDDGPAPRIGPSGWSAYGGGITEIGHEGRSFAFDNERPRHKALIRPFELQDRLVTAGEFLAFVEDDGYGRSDLWLSLGWATRKEQGWTAPLYWVERDGAWSQFTLGGLKPLRLDEPVCHLSYFEADAFARWSGARLPTETEWEHAAAGVDPELRFAPAGRFHPASAVTGGERRGSGSSCTARSGNGRRALTRPIPGIEPPRARSANTTASLCAINTSCAAARASPRPAIRDPRIATSFRPRRVGNSPGCDWLATSRSDLVHPSRLDRDNVAARDRVRCGPRR